MKILVSESVNENRIKLITKKVLNERYFLEVEMTQILNEAEEELLLESDSIEKLKEIARMFGNGYVRWMSNMMKKGNLLEEDIYKYMDFFKYFEEGKKLGHFTSKDIFQYKDSKQFEQEAIESRRKIMRTQGEGGEIDGPSMVSPQQIQKLESVGIKFLGITPEGFQVFKIPKELKDNHQAFETQKNILGRCQGRERGEKISICTMGQFDHFNTYVGKDDLYVFFNMEDPHAPYQFHYQSDSFMDKNDFPVIKRQKGEGPILLLAPQERNDTMIKNFFQFLYEKEGREIPDKVKLIEIVRPITKRILNELFSQKLVDNLITKFKEQDPGLKDDVVNFYIDRFQQIKDSPKVQNKDITTYSWQELKELVDYNQPEEPNIEIQGSDLLYNKEGIKVYLANTKRACVKYGTGYNFCISSRGHDNQYEDYRYNHRQTIYFVVDENKSKEMHVNKGDGSDFLDDGKFEDPTHLLVVMVDEPSDVGQTYTVYTANNDPVEEKIYYKWSDLEDDFPNLYQLEHILVPRGIDYTEEQYVNLKHTYQRKIYGLNQQNLIDDPAGTFDHKNGMIPFTDINDVNRNLEIINNYLSNKPAYSYSIDYGGEDVRTIYPNNTSLDKWLKQLIDLDYIDYDDMTELQKKQGEDFKNAIKITPHLPSSTDSLNYVKKIKKIYMDFLHEKNKLNMPDETLNERWRT